MMCTLDVSFAPRAGCLAVSAAPTSRASTMLRVSQSHLPATNRHCIELLCDLVSDIFYEPLAQAIWEVQLLNYIGYL
jgi:hypothetical protein